jgi:hypothetical protein
MSQQYYESWVDKQIREAQERGDFDDLPGAGKPLPHLGDPDDADWWVKGYIKRENLDISGALPTPLALRKEAAGFPESLADVRQESQVREILEDFNHRVKADRLRPTVGQLPPLIARTVDVEEALEQWRVLRAATEAQRPAPAAATEERKPTPRPWWRRGRRVEKP